MAKETKGGLEIFENPEALQEQLTKTEQFAKSNQKYLMGAGIAIVLIVAAIIFYQWNNEKKNNEAQLELFPAVFYMEKDSLGKAIAGDNNNTTIGFKQITQEYSGTKAATLANFYLGVNSLQEGRYDEAIAYLEKFNPNDLLVQARVYSLIGDAYMEKSDLPNAIKYYKRASEYHPNESFTPTYLLKLALAYELNKDLKSAATAYKQITEDFKESPDKALAQKQFARITQLMEGKK